MGDRVGLVVVKVGSNDGPDGARVAIIVGDFVWIPVGIKVIGLNVGLTDWNIVGKLVCIPEGTLLGNLLEVPVDTLVGVDVV